MNYRPILTTFISGFLLCGPTALLAGTAVSSGAIFPIHASDDLDLQGEMAYAINFSPDDAPFYVHGVRFTPDYLLPPALTTGPNNVAQFQTRPEFGSGFDADNLEKVFEDIRWAATDADQTLQAHLPVVPGNTYKLQILLYGNAPETRRWDIMVEGTLAVDEITSLGASGAGGTVPAHEANTGIVYTRTFVALDNSVDVIMGDLGGLSDGGDRNPVWQGLTLERIVPDTDLDGMPDAWELAKFNNLLALGTADADADGLPNQYEYQLDTQPKVKDSDGDGLEDGNEYFVRGTNPKLADTDGDGLNDGAEITAGSNPLLPDTDGDGLPDGAEVLTYGTNPADPDSDNDDYSDNIEITLGTNALSASAYPLFASYQTTFTGGDQDEGLDFDGTFALAARFGPSGMSGSWAVRNATFQPYDSISGLTQDAPEAILDWVLPAFPGTPSASDNALTQAMRSIRFGGPVVNLARPGLTPGRAYKLQLLFAEGCCANRGFDIFVEGQLIADNFAPSALQGGPSYSPSRGIAVVHGFIAGDSALNIRLSKLGVSDPFLDDPNALISALTLEEIPPLADSDSDGLPDLWEITWFGSTTAQNGAGDPDADGLTNTQEFAAFSNPNVTDTDGDGLSDSVEYLTHHSNARMVDTDDDGLPDGYEVTVSHSSPIDTDTDKDTLPDGEEVTIFRTSPLSIDSDGDGYNDPTELISGSDPASRYSRPPATFTARVLGPDRAQGLDLEGIFPYAVNVGPGGAAGSVNGLPFTADNVPGVTLSAPNAIANWVAPDFGATPAQDALEDVFRDIRWADLEALLSTDRTIRLDLTGLTIGKTYKLQLLFSEACCPLRTFDIIVGGSTVLSGFSPGSAQNTVPLTNAGVAVVHQFFAADSDLHVVLDGSNVFPFPGFEGDPTLAGFTLEELAAIVPLELETTSINSSSITINARGTPGRSYSVDFSPDMLTWTEATGALTADVLGDATWTDTDPVRTGPAAIRGFYKLRDPADDPAP